MLSRRRSGGCHVGGTARSCDWLSSRESGRTIYAPSVRCQFSPGNSYWRWHLPWAPVPAPNRLFRPELGRHRPGGWKRYGSAALSNSSSTGHGVTATVPAGAVSEATKPLRHTFLRHLGISPPPQEFRYRRNDPQPGGNVCRFSRYTHLWLPTRRIFRFGQARQTRVLTPSFRRLARAAHQRPKGFRWQGRAVSGRSSSGGNRTWKDNRRGVVSPRCSHGHRSTPGGPDRMTSGALLPRPRRSVVVRS